MRNRRYETVFILSSDSDEGKKRDILDRLDGVVEKGGGAASRGRIGASAGWPTR